MRNSVCSSSSLRPAAGVSAHGLAPTGNLAAPALRSIPSPSLLSVAAFSSRDCAMFASSLHWTRGCPLSLCLRRRHCPLLWLVLSALRAAQPSLRVALPALRWSFPRREVSRSGHDTRLHVRRRGWDTGCYPQCRRIVRGGLGCWCCRTVSHQVPRRLCRCTSTRRASCALGEKRLVSVRRRICWSPHTHSGNLIWASPCEIQGHS